MVNSLLKAIPKGIKLPRNPWLRSHFATHSVIMGMVGYTFMFYMIAVPIARFPITLGNPNRAVFKCEPDYATGAVVTYTTEGLRYFDFI